MLPASEMAWMSAIVASSLDVTVTVQRKSAGQDIYGHANGTYTTTSTPKINICKPTSTQLQQFASIIGSQWALMIRFMPTTDIKEADHLLYNGQTWTVQNIQNAESYTFANEALITAVV